MQRAAECEYSNASWQWTLWQASGISPGFPSLSLLLSAGQGIYLNQMQHELIAFSHAVGQRQHVCSAWTEMLC